jgi:hypothetical protein
MDLKDERSDCPNKKIEYQFYKLFLYHGGEKYRARGGEKCRGRVSKDKGKRIIK